MHYTALLPALLSIYRQSKHLKEGRCSVEEKLKSNFPSHVFHLIFIVSETTTQLLLTKKQMRRVEGRPTWVKISHQTNREISIKFFMRFTTPTICISSSVCWMDVYGSILYLQLQHSTLKLKWKMFYFQFFLNFWTVGEKMISYFTRNRTQTKPTMQFKITSRSNRLKQQVEEQN